MEKRLLHFMTGKWRNMWRGVQVNKQVSSLRMHAVLPIWKYLFLVAFVIIRKTVCVSRLI